MIDPNQQLNEPVIPVGSEQEEAARAAIEIEAARRPVSLAASMLHVDDFLARETIGSRPKQELGEKVDK